MKSIEVIAAGRAKARQARRLAYGVRGDDRERLLRYSTELEAEADALEQATTSTPIAIDVPIVTKQDVEQKPSASMAQTQEPTGEGDNKQK